MSWTKKLSTVVPRRTVLKGLAATGAAGLLGSSSVHAKYTATGTDIATTTRMSSSHWGSFTANLQAGRLTYVTPFEKDPYPSPIIQGLPDRLYANNRIKYPMIRRGYYENRSASDPTKRGAEPFVRVSWDEAFDIVAEEMTRVADVYGRQAIFGGSNGWRNAGKLHDPQNLLKRFLSGYGGFTNETGGYSWAASKALLPYVVGTQAPRTGSLTSWSNIIENSELVVLFGTGVTRNSEITRGGGGEHSTKKWLAEAKRKGLPFISIDPVENDDVGLLDARWIAPRPRTNVALMLGIAHTLYTEGLHDQEFLDTYTFGFERFAAYLTGESDGQPKTAEWAAQITDVDASVIRELATTFAGNRTMIMGGPALQRARYGEQDFWMLITLASMLGQIGLPGGGFGFGYGYYDGFGDPGGAPSVPGVPRGPNPHGDMTIPTARISDMLLRPGETYQFDGEQKVYPDIKMIYWAGGAPFEHHQDVNKLIRAWQRPETVIVQEPWWTSHAKYADIVLPATMTLERNDIARQAGFDRFIMAMQQAVEPLFEAKNDFDIYSGIAERLGFADAFTEGRTEMEWLQHLYAQAQEVAQGQGLAMPSFDEFWEAGYVEFPAGQESILFQDFRENPALNPLGTDSGRINIYSEKIAGYGYDDCPPHPTWLEPPEWLGGDTSSYPVQMIEIHPPYRLHSQLNNTWLRTLHEVQHREEIWISPTDADARGIQTGDVVRVFNDRGQLLAGAVVTDRVRTGVVSMSHGGWYDPAEAGVPGTLDQHGNVNVITHDIGSSKLGQGATAKGAMVQIEKYDAVAPYVTAFEPPAGG